MLSDNVYLDFGVICFFIVKRQLFIDTNHMITHLRPLTKDAHNVGFCDLTIIVITYSTYIIILL